MGVKMINKLAKEMQTFLKENNSEIIAVIDSNGYEFQIAKELTNDEVLITDENGNNERIVSVKRKS